MNGIDRSHDPYLVHIPALAGTSIDAAIATAAHGTLVKLYPQQRSMLNDALQDSLDDVPNGAPKLKGILYGRFVATLTLVSRLFDGASRQVEYVVNPAPGHWSPDPLNPTQTALGPTGATSTRSRSTAGTSSRRRTRRP